ncbi:hypothetical protein AtubIFM54640_010794 [Aspergillus tubingensis]|nr:hypothetical protein AtubIFM54640_010794 [Aspergillus tubingensis]
MQVPLPSIPPYIGRSETKQSRGLLVVHTIISLKSPIPQYDIRKMEAKKNLLCAQLEGRESPAPESQTAEQQAPLCWGRIPRNLQQPAYNSTEGSSDPVKPFVLESNPVHPLEAPLAAQYAHDKKRSISE